ncbi:MAG: biotin carboxylase N-terminal domain-containing protein [Solirubrobacterales bacterium]
MRELGPLLIANRGEIAIRVARSARALGLPTVAVVTAADARANSAHADAADVGVAVSSYLDGEELLRAAAASGARSVHPGYGFLAENASFARAVVEAGLTWIGPPPAAIELMGDKARAKEVAEAAGVPVVPSGEGAEESDYPLVVKAVAGGGGKGMRVVRSPGELDAATAAAKREAASAFGDERVLIERYIERPRHIEVQVLADSHGSCVHLGERECSLQRRHQKVVEEAPSPVVDEALRERMGAAAVALAEACGYEGAGTVEFIATGDASEFFFLEMNTRLQVEHPVTELVYGVDLVAEQLRAAAGEPLAFSQEDLVSAGHAIEARLYAEDPGAGFLPTTGRVRVYREPAGPGVRVDSGIRLGSVVGTDYDPMLAKVIAHGPDRETAMARLDRALAGFDLAGVTTNAAFTRQLLGREDVRAGEQDTGLLERVLGDFETGPPADLAAAGVLVAAGGERPAGPWLRALESFDTARVADGSVTVGERRGEGPSLRRDSEGAARVSLDGVERRYAVAVEGETVWICRDGHHLELRAERHDRSSEVAPEGSLEAPMPGTVLLVNVVNGDAVVEGDVLIVLESMKMELPVAAPYGGVVTGLELEVGDQVALGQPLVAVVEEEEEGG